MFVRPTRAGGIKEFVHVFTLSAKGKESKIYLGRILR
jgi:hypothetical protein